MQKLLTFFSKNTCELKNVFIRTINILTTNKLVMLTMLWATGSRYVLLLAILKQWFQWCWLFVWPCVCSLRVPVMFVVSLALCVLAAGSSEFCCLFSLVCARCGFQRFLLFVQPCMCSLRVPVMFVVCLSLCVLAAGSSDVCCLFSLVCACCGFQWCLLFV